MPKPVQGFDRTALRVLAARAATLDERFAGRVQPAPDGGADARRQADIMFQAWQASAAADDEVLFARILAEHGVSAETAPAHLGPVVLPAEAALPAWAETFQRAFAALQRVPDDGLSENLGSTAADLPFERLFYPLVAAARGWRDEGLEAGKSARLSAKAHHDLDRALLTPLTQICVRALNDRLNSRVYAGTLAGRFGGGSQDVPRFASGEKTSRAALVADFVERLRGDGLKRLFEERPVLARLVATVVDHWIEGAREFIDRLAEDLDGAIAALAGDGSPPSRVVRLGTGLSDLHNGGRSVMKVTFDTGLVLAYKPKDLRVDLAFQGLLDWMAACKAPPSASLPATQACDGYGWVEWVEPAPCRDREDARRFFHRSGAMLCLFRTLQGTDFHLENVVARGSVPCPVDLETVMHPRIGIPTDLEPGAALMAAALMDVQDSVLVQGSGSPDPIKQSRVFLSSSNGKAWP